jgi:hypothetical protein
MFTSTNVGPPTGVTVSAVRCVQSGACWVSMARVREWSGGRWVGVDDARARRVLWVNLSRACVRAIESSGTSPRLGPSPLLLLLPPPAFLALYASRDGQSAQRYEDLGLARMIVLRRERSTRC